MRLTVSLFGREVFALSTDPPEQSPGYEHDHTAAQVERAAPVPIGFRIDKNPSLED